MVRVTSLYLRFFERDVVDIDVVIPTIGRPSLRATLIGVLKQTEACNIVIVDDSVGGSSSDSIDELVDRALQSVAAPRHTLEIRRTGGVGLSAARNSGMSCGSSRAVAFLDDDDIICRHHLARLLESAEPPLERAFVWSAARVVLIDESGGHVTNSGFGWDDALCILPITNAFPPSCVLVGRAILPVFDESIPGLEDWEAWLQILKRYQPTLSYTGAVTVGYVKNLRMADAMSVHAMSHAADHTRLLECYETICERYDTKDSSVLGGRRHIRSLVHSRMAGIQHGHTLAFDYYESDLSLDFGPPTLNDCADFEFAVAEYLSADSAS